MPPRPTDEVRTTESIADLIRSLATDLSTLFSKELSLAKAEIREAAQDAQKGVTGMAAGAALAFAGLIFVLLAITFALGNEIPLWAASLIVGGVALLVGYAMLRAARNKIQPSAFVPERAAQSVKKDTQTAKRAIQ
jgi:hypothetical protein